MIADQALEVVVPAEVMEKLRGGLFTVDGCENFAVLLCAPAVTEHRVRLLVRDWTFAPLDAYRERLSYHLEIAPAFFNTIVDRAMATGLHPVLVHSHPDAGEARYSPSDDFGEGRLLPVLEQLLPGRTVVSMLLTPTDVQGRLHRRGRFVPLSRITVLGNPVITYVPPTHVPEAVRTGDATYDRQIRAFGGAAMSRVQELRIAVVGAGGTGSAVLEQLARLGVRFITIVDPDLLEQSNLSRVYGSLPADASTRVPKVDVAARHLRAISPDLSVRVVQSDVTRQSVLNVLRDHDVLFGCTDNHWSRAVLNRFAHQYLLPLVDMGVRLDARHGSVEAAAGQVTLAGPGLSCLRCSQLIDPERVRVESMPLGEREVLTAEGYVIGLDDPVPSVISLNTTVAGMAVTAAVSLFVNLTGAAPPTGIRYDARTASTFAVAPRHDALCDVCSQECGVGALGDLQPVSAYE